MLFKPVFVDLQGSNLRFQSRRKPCTPTYISICYYGSAQEAEIYVRSKYRIDDQDRRVAKGRFRPLRQPREAAVRWFETIATAYSSGAMISSTRASFKA